MFLISDFCSIDKALSLIKSTIIKARNFINTRDESAAWKENSIPLSAGFVISANELFWSLDGDFSTQNRTKRSKYMQRCKCVHGYLPMSINECGKIETSIIKCMFCRGNQWVPKEEMETDDSSSDSSDDE